VRRWMGFGLVAMLCGSLGPGAAGAQPVPGTADAKPLVLLCAGATSNVMSAQPRFDLGYGRPSLRYGVQREAAQLGVMVEKGEVRVRPPPGSRALLDKAEPDGWYRLEKPEVTEFLIRARTPSGRVLNEKLDIDRRTGAVTFADFIGTCRVQPTSAAGTQF